MIKLWFQRRIWRAHCFFSRHRIEVRKYGSHNRFVCGRCEHSDDWTLRELLYSARQRSRLAVAALRARLKGEQNDDMPF